MNDSKLTHNIQNGVGTITFANPKGNSLPGVLLNELASTIDLLGKDPQVKVLLLTSEGEKTFCAGASFDEFKRAENIEMARKFFSGFAAVILAIRRCPKFVVARVQGKAVGGGVGLISACDYALATEAASVRLSELAIGIGPFIIGPAVERKIGFAAFNAMSIDADWRSAKWAQQAGLYVNIYPSITELDQQLTKFLSTLVEYSPKAMSELKTVLWQNSSNWEKLLYERVEFTAALSLTPHVRTILANS